MNTQPTNDSGNLSPEDAKQLIKAIEEVERQEADEQTQDAPNDER